MRSGLSSSLLATIGALSGIAAALSVDSTVLILGRDEIDVKGTSPALDAYGIPWEKHLVPKSGGTLPALTSSDSDGRYGSIVLVGSLSYDDNGVFKTALTDAQWKQLNDYQSKFKVRMVRINEYPGPNFGATLWDTTNPGCCDKDTQQGISLTDTSSFAGAGLKANAILPTTNLYHYPAKITMPDNTTAFAHFEAAGRFTEKTVAGVINKFGDREQMAFFTSLAPEWSLTSAFLQHAYVHWMTRSVFSGKRKVHLNVQVDDVHLSTGLFHPAGKEYRTNTGDMDAHVEWQRGLNSRLPSGSSFWLEMGHNGNGDIITATGKRESEGICVPKEAVDYVSPPDSKDLEFKKPLGTGTDLWSNQFTTYNWTKPCAQLDDLASWFLNPDKRDAFAHMSHTFSHLELNNATYKDAAREIHFNQAWMKQLGLDQASKFSPEGLIPPAITGLHNGDVIKAWTDNGIKYVVGDNTRPVLKNRENKYWPLASNVQDNGATGIWIVPRYATTIYFNCDTEECDIKEWDFVSKRKGTFNDLLDDARTVNVPYLLNLQCDPYMFHQANMRWTNMPSRTIGTETGTFSLIVSWVETVTQEMYRLTNWPITSLKHDDFTRYFLDRMTVDKCKPRLKYTYSDDGVSITAVTLTTEGNSCSAPVPVTIPSGSASGGDSSMDQVGSEPPIAWVNMAGSPVTLQLSDPVRLL